MAANESNGYDHRHPDRLTEIASMIGKEWNGKRTPRKPGMRRESQWKRVRLAGQPGMRETHPLSSLPDSIVHRIMSFLPMNDAVRMMVLSKEFLYLCRSFPVAKFKYYSKLFREHRRCVLTTCTDFESLSLVAPWCMNTSEFVMYALQNNVIEMIMIKCPFSYFDVFHQITGSVLPYFVFGSKSIKKLSLSGYLFDQRVMKIECPLMEELNLTDFMATPTSTTINISCPKLKTVKLSDLRNVEKIQIHDNTAKSLESFSFSIHINQAMFHYKDIVNLASCKSLKALKLCHVEVDDSWFVSNVLRLDSLESLSLKRCRSLKNLVMRSEKLVVVELEYCTNLVCVDLDAINLVRFRLERGARKCRVKLTKCRHLRELTLRSDVAVPTAAWTLNFEFLEKLKLSSWTNVKTLTVKAPRLMLLEVERCPGLIGPEIITPKLLYYDEDKRSDIIRNTTLNCEAIDDFDDEDIY